MTSFDAGREPIQKLAVIVTYAMLLNVFFILLELFTALYSQIPEHMEHFEFLFLGLHGQAPLVPWMWTSSVLAVASLVLLLVPSLQAPRVRAGGRRARWSSCRSGSTRASA